jgi:hypothetical protein
VMFTMDYEGGYAWRSDFHWDGTLNLSDVVLLSTSLGAGCPEGRAVGQSQTLRPTVTWSPQPPNGPVSLRP